MRQRRGGVYGPYQHRRQWRVDVVGADGRRSVGLYETEAEALGVIRSAREKLGLVSGITVQEALDKYEMYQRYEKENKPRSVEATRLRLKRFLGPVAALRLRQLTEDRCASLYRALVAELAADTHRNCLAEAKTWARWCIKKGWLTKSPLERVEGQGRRRRGKAQLRVNEARAWLEKAVELAEAGDDGAVAAMCCLFLGMRTTEVVERVGRDLDNGGALLWIDDSKTEAGRRVVEVPELLRGPLRRVASAADPGLALFPHDRHWVRKQVQRVCRLAGVKRTTAHGMRGTIATIAVDAGLRLQDISRGLGHADTKITQAAYVQADAGREAQASAFLRLIGGKTVETKEGPEDDASEPSSTTWN